MKIDNPFPGSGRCTWSVKHQVVINRAKSYEQHISPVSEEELLRIIDEAEEDSKEGRLTPAVELKKDIDSWN